jgi:hypothetical protein
LVEQVKDTFTIVTSPPGPPGQMNETTRTIGEVLEQKIYCTKIT